MISQETIEKILHESEISRVIGEFLPLTSKGNKMICDCPNCNKKDGLSISKARQIYKCFGCGFKGNSAVAFVEWFKKVSFPAALKIVAGIYGIDASDAPKAKGPQRKIIPKQETFRDKQLKASGISDADQKANFVSEDKVTIVDVFEAGTRDQYNKLTIGDDMIIWYYDLEGKPVMYLKPKSTKAEQLYRVRWQNPDLHRDKFGRPAKYASPYGSGSHLFIPESLRQIYKERRPFKRLFIQEGEKKALKASLHGLPSVGVMGIQNIASAGRLPFELQLIISTCKVEEVVFVLDSDWDQLSRNLKPGDKVDSRPYNFFYAVRNFREYFKTFINMGIYLETYFAYIKPNPANDKGLDDLLANTLAGKEIELLNDINITINEKNGVGKFIQLHKITTVSDLKLLEFWDLHNAEAFSKRYKEELLQLPEFTIGKHKWRFNDAQKLEAAQPLQEDEQYWEISRWEDKSGKTRTDVRFRYLYAYNFLKRRGFGRLMMANRQYQLARIENKVVSIYEAYQIRDFMTDFTKEIVDKKDLVDVMDMLFRGGNMYFGPDKLGQIDFMYPKFETSNKEFQLLFFKDKFWRITAEGIVEHKLNDLQYNVWKDKINDFDAKLLPNNFITVKRFSQKEIDTIPNSPIDKTILLNQYDIKLSQDAQQCHFLDFVYNTGEFFWNKFIDPNGWKPLPTDQRSITERLETALHFVSKMTAIGYLLHKFRDKSCEKAVIGMDGKLSEIGDSNGRTGKSLIGIALGHIIPQTYIGGKSRDLTEDQFIWEEVTEKIDNIFLDDVRANIDFEFFFPVITGKITINTKGTKKFTLSEAETPKIYITTNHAINGDSASFKDRQFNIAFSDYYNDSHKPIEDYGVNFFAEWDEKQWNLFYNFMARCLQLYFYAAKVGWGINGTGLVQCPLERLELRRLRQFVGEAFLTWADEYFGSGDDIDSNDINNNNINRRIARTELFNDFLDRNPNEKKFTNAFKFKKKILAFCKFRQFKFNPQKLNLDDKILDDKSGGVEYFTIANRNYTSLNTLNF
ncbi:MAG: CHC2 zinc finger domain-containing protein [Bacteroidales bacterium]